MRVMRVYPLVESDVSDLKAAAAFAGLSFSFAWLLIGAAITIFTSAAFSVQLSPAAETMKWVVAPICASAGVLFLIFGVLNAWRQIATWGRLKKETVVQSITSKSP